MKNKESLKEYIIEELAALFSIFCLVAFLGGLIYVIFCGTIYVNKTECTKWNGEYHWSTGCIVNYKDTRITLSDYKEVKKMELSKPIETNTNIKLGAE